VSEGSEKPESGGEGEPAPAKSTASSEGQRWAADEPTAMWDDKALRDEGYPGVADAAPGIAPSGPATGPDVGGHERANVVSKGGAQQGGAPAPALAAGGGLSWPLTIAIATLVAVVVYFAVRMLR
jgi:hypothetical protein